ncbi:MAG: radical SAM protein, partial [Armatimonadetes bacterium]|nr:radical SAM protein [Armatimonadota bacterium]
MAKCQICGKGSRTVARVLSLCGDCLKSRFEEAEQIVKEVHAHSRRPFRLPERPPAESDGIICAICSQSCRIPKGGIGYCGLPHGDRKRTAVVSWYYDPLPTNCVADFVCPGGTGCGYPRYA